MDNEVRPPGHSDGGQETGGPGRRGLSTWSSGARSLCGFAIASDHAVSRSLAGFVLLKKATPLPMFGRFLVFGSVSFAQKLKSATSRSNLGQLPGVKRTGKR